MADIINRSFEGHLRRLKDMGDGTYAEVVSTSGAVLQVVPDFVAAADLLAAYDNFNEVNWAGGDFVTLTKYSNGQSVTALSCNPLNPGESRVMVNYPVHQPAALEVEASVIRNRQHFSTLALYSNGSTGIAAPVPNPINIVSIYQSNADAGAAYSAVAGTICTVVLETALPAHPDPAAVYLSDWINITGLVDSRLNYQNAAIKFISADRKTITFGFSDDAALTSLAVPVITPTLGEAKVNFYNNMGGAADGFGFRFTGTSATLAAIVSVFNNSDAQVTGTLFGDHRVTVSTTAPQYLNGVMGNVELKASSRYRLEARAGSADVLDKGIESASTSWTSRVSRTAVKPSIGLPLYPRFRVYQPVGMSRPVAKIVSIAKAGSTTWTVTTEAAHGLTTGNYVTIKGSRDQTNFAAFATPVAVIVTGANTFTLIGTTGTATGYGGSVCLTNGNADQPGIIGQAVSSVAQLTGQTDWLSVVGNTNWSGLSVGDYINLHGVLQDLTGTNLALDGAWEVANLATTTMILKPIVSVLGTRISPATPAIGTTPVNAGGSVILRTTARMHDLMLEGWSETKSMLDGQGTTRLDKAMPVQVVNSPAITISSGTVTTVTTVAALTGGGVAEDAAAGANPVVVGGVVRTAVAPTTLVAGDAARITMTGGAAVVNKPFSVPEADFQYSGTLTTTTAAVAKAAGAAGVRNYVTGIQYQNTNATATTVIVLDGVTAILTLQAPASMALPAVVPLLTPLKGTAATALNVNCGTTGASVLMNIQGYQAP